MAARSAGVAVIVELAEHRLQRVGRRRRGRRRRRRRPSAAGRAAAAVVPSRGPARAADLKPASSSASRGATTPTPSTPTSTWKRSGVTSFTSQPDSSSRHQRERGYQVRLPSVHTNATPQRKSMSSKKPTRPRSPRRSVTRTTSLMCSPSRQQSWWPSISGMSGSSSPHEPHIKRSAVRCDGHLRPSASSARLASVQRQTGAWFAFGEQPGRVGHRVPVGGRVVRRHARAAAARGSRGATNAERASAIIGQLSDHLGDDDESWRPGSCEKVPLSHPASSRGDARRTSPPASARLVGDTSSIPRPQLAQGAWRRGKGPPRSGRTGRRRRPAPVAERRSPPQYRRPPRAADAPPLLFPSCFS